MTTRVSRRVATAKQRLAIGIARRCAGTLRRLGACILSQLVGERWLIRSSPISSSGLFVFLLAFVPIAAAQPSSSCAPCHAKIAETYARTGMARSFGKLAPNTALPAMNAFRHEPSAQTFSLPARGGVTYLRREQDANILEKPVSYWIGSGNHARTYLTRNAANELLELPTTWYAENGGHWGMSPGYAGPAHAGFSRKINYSCMFCHNAYPAADPALEAQHRTTIFPAELPEGIDCQRCHGSGKSHIEAARRGAPSDAIRAAIVNPARLAPARRLEVCLQCHMETTSLRLPASLTRFDRSVFSYRPGEPLENYALHFDHAPGTGHDDKFEFSSSPYRLQKSRCFLASQGKLTCTTCHNPHDIPRGPEAVAQYSQACRTCHTSALSPSHSAVTECISCHMPRRRPSDATQVTVTDHYIRKRPGPGVEPALESNDANAPPYQGPVLPYYPPALAHTPENELYVAVAQVTQQANLAAGIPVLEAAIAKAAPKSAEFYLELAEAWRHAGRPEKAIPAYRQTISRAPADWRPVYGLGNSLAATGDLPLAASTLQRAAALAPYEPAPLLSLAKVLTRQNKLAAAIAALRKAVELDSESAEAHNDLGTALFRNGDAASAEKSVREAVRLRPEIAAIRVNLADLTARRGAFAEARKHYEFAAQLDPQSPTAFYKLALLFIAQGQFVEARQQLKLAIERAPNYQEARQKLAELQAK